MKKLIIRFLQRRFIRNYYYVRDNAKFYHFLRWIAEFVNDKDVTDHVMCSIASYMYKNGVKLPFSDIFVIGDMVIVCTLRPSMWIGKGGSTMDGITEELNFNKKDYNFNIRMFETTHNAVANIASYIHVMNNY